MQTFDSVLAPHADAMRLRHQRTQLLASNIANADTPGYKARDLAFGAALQEANGMRKPSMMAKQPLATSHARHIRTASSIGADRARVMYRAPEHASLDGNTVDKDLEQSRFAENTLRYQASMQFFGSRVKSMIKVLKGE